jgi:hypothetical protein
VSWRVFTEGGSGRRPVVVCEDSTGAWRRIGQFERGSGPTSSESCLARKSCWGSHFSPTFSRPPGASGVTEPCRRTAWFRPRDEIAPRSSGFLAARLARGWDRPTPLARRRDAWPSPQVSRNDRDIRGPGGLPKGSTRAETQDLRFLGPAGASTGMISRPGPWNPQSLCDAFRALSPGSAARDLSPHLYHAFTRRAGRASRSPWAPLPLDRVWQPLQAGVPPRPSRPPCPFPLALQIPPEKAPSGACAARNRGSHPSSTAR